MKPLPSAELLWDMYDYNPLTGELILKKDSGPKPSRTPRYYILHFPDGHYKAHRIIIKWITGKDPQGIVEHKNDNGHDNSLVNLLDSNQRANKRTQLGGRIRGCMQLPNGRFAAAIQTSDGKISLGTYNTEAEATDAYDTAAEELSLNPDWRPGAISSLEVGSSGYRFAFKHGPNYRSQYTYKGVKYRVGTFDSAYEASIMAIAHKLENHWSI